MWESGDLTQTKSKIIVRGIIAGDDTPSDVELRGGMVARVGPVQNGRAAYGSMRARIGPTLFDIQVNGGFGIDLQSKDLSVEDVSLLNDRLQSWGVSRWVPTIITASMSRMERTCRVLAEAMEDSRLRRALQGIHLEGPHISPLDGPRGAHEQRHVRPPDRKDFARLFDAAQGRILYTTVAPELTGAIAYIRKVTSLGVVVSLGHHMGSNVEVRRATEAGARLCTHLGNGVAPNIHRHENPLWPQLAEDRLTCSLIADGHHLPPEVLKVFIRAKGKKRIVLTSDAVHLAGLKSGKYKLGAVPVELKNDGRICLSGTELLAGSSLMLLQGVANAAKTGALSIREAFACASQVPARLLGVANAAFPPRLKTKANFCVYQDSARSNVKPLVTFIGGQAHAPTSEG